MEQIEQIQSMLENKRAIALEGVPEAVYHAFPAFSNSGMSEFKKAPGYWDYMRKNPKPDTPARLFGRMVHMAIGEPTRFQSDVVCVDGNRNSNEVKSTILFHQGQGKTVCKTEDHKLVTEIASYCRAHPLVADILSSGKPEVSFFWIDKATGAPCKARVDWLKNHGIMNDWKTFSNVFDTKLLEYQIRTMDYQFQKKWYEMAFEAVYGFKPKAFYNTFIRDEPPHDLRVVKICDFSTEETVPYIRTYVEQFAECLKKDTWPMTPPEVTEITIAPFWK